MANGDVTKIAILSRTKLPGGGTKTDGTPVQNKVLLTGELTCTYVSTGINIASTTGVADGQTLPVALGFENLDFIDFSLKSTDGAAPDDDKLYHFDVSHSTWLIYAVEDVGQADAAAPGNGDAIVLSFMAVGDDRGAAELT
jgi:hypothetical protein